MPLHTSPFPTTHDTIGASTLSSPVQVPSSPPSPSPPSRRITGNNNGSSKEQSDQVTTAPASNDIGIFDLDKRLSQYTVDWNKFPGGSKDNIENELDDEDQAPQFGGPEDFTMNLDKYLQEMAPPEDSKQQEGRDPESEDDALPEYSPSPSPRPRSHHGHNNQEEAEESEFGPPVDISTPSHLLWRKNYGLGKEETRLELEDIEESLPSSPEKGDSPSKSGKQNDMEESRTFTTVLREIEDLHEQRRERDEKIEAHEKQLASAREEIENLRAKLQLKDSLLSEANENVEKVDMLREQLQALQEQAASTDDGAKEMVKLQEELKEARDQLERRDEALKDSSTKLHELTANSELQLRQKNSEIEALKTRIDENELQLADADEDMAEVQQQFEIFKERIESLEKRNSPLEEKNILLEKELSAVKAELSSQKNAVLTMAADLSVETQDKDYTEVIGSLQQQLKDLKVSHRDHGMSAKVEEDLQNEIDQTKLSLQRTINEKEAAETEWQRSKDLLSETRSLVTTIEGENNRLTGRIQELNSALVKSREEIDRLKELHRQELASINIQPTPAEPISAILDQTNELREAHRLEIQNLREIHQNSIHDLRTSYNDTIQDLRTMLSTSEKRATSLHNQLLETRSETTAQANEITSLRTEIKQLQSTLALKEEASAEMDAMIAKSIEKREREWERRTELLLKERDKMGKALMWAWGEKEVGKSSSSERLRRDSTTAAAAPGDASTSEEKKARQGYRYKYVVRS